VLTGPVVVLRKSDAGRGSGREVGRVGRGYGVGGEARWTRSQLHSALPKSAYRTGRTGCGWRAGGGGRVVAGGGQDGLLLMQLLLVVLLLLPPPPPEDHQTVTFLTSSSLYHFPSCGERLIRTQNPTPTPTESLTQNPSPSATISLSLGPTLSPASLIPADSCFC
jgi:hypothetical protein